ncbi:L,D-transpeptidase [Limosilactobacillus antri]|uniref:L,D-transpeptidase n=1 Tax=Limosilactobacillus antri TaxID=227943 RepID=UPI001F599CBC|nr:L,D-transpeptidase [Limosilactobacillus antri]
MKLAVKNRIYAGICLVVAIVGMGPELRKSHRQSPKPARQAQLATDHQQAVHRSHSPARSSKMRVPIDWRKSSETVPYPDLAKTKDFWVKVSLKKNRTYLYDGQKLLYTMYSTGGMYKRNPQTGKMESMTPTGTYYAQSERGDSFFNSSLNEGANYYVSWLDHGTYLFHSVPTVAGGNYNVAEAKKLGKSTGSHGCIRLSVPDAQWMSTHLPVGTKIVIVN